MPELRRGQGVYLSRLHLNDSGLGAAGIVRIVGVFRHVLDVGGLVVVFVLVSKGSLAIFSAGEGDVIEFVLGVLGEGLGLGRTGFGQFGGLQVPIAEVMFVDEAVRRVGDRHDGVLVAH